MTPGIYFDMDGVLCHFVRGAIAHHGGTLDPDTAAWGLEAQMGIAPDVFWKNLDYAFWAGLEPYPDGFALLEAAEGLVGAGNISLLSSPCDTDGCMDGKRDWVRRHLPGYKRRLFLGSDKAVHAAPNKILVDDHAENTAKFFSAGGHVVMPPRPWNPRGVECAYPGGLFDVAAVAAELTSKVRAVRGKL